MEKIKFGIIGCGRIAQRHADIISKIAVLTSVCDVDRSKADELAGIYSCRPYYDAGELLEKENDTDVIAVCTPNGLHKLHTLISLRAGKNVVCEKPMATSVKDCMEMIQEKETQKKKLFIVKQNRFNPPVEALKKAIDQKRLGKVFNIHVNCFWNRNERYYSQSDWKGKKDLDGGTLFTQFSHFIDLIYWLMGDVKSVHALGKNFIHEGLIDFEDTGAVTFEFGNGAIGTLNYTVNSFSKNMEGSITVFGEKGTVKVGGQYLNMLEYQNIEGYRIEGLPQSRPANDYGFYQGSMSNHEKVYENVIDVLKNNGTIAANAFEGMKTVEIIEKIYKSVKDNLELKI